MHSITEYEENILLEKVYNSLRKEGLFFIEARRELGFIIIFSVEDNNLAIYKNENPIVVRIIAKK